MDFTISPFILSTTFDRKTYSLQVTQIYLSSIKEVFKITYGERSLEIQSNRPLIRGKGLNKKRIEWKVLSNNVNYQSQYEQIRGELESHIKKIEKPPVSWQDNPKNKPY